jgi:RNA polymerase sigma-B factor
MAAISSRTVRPGRPVDVAVVPAGLVVRELAELDDRELLELVGSLPRASERRAAACEVLVSRHRNLVRSCARRYLRSPEPAEDLMQVGYVGLVKAISNFDPAVGGSLAAYAQATVSGEMKRHFRDTRWQVHVRRTVQELVLEVRTATGQLTQELGRAPDESDLARYLGVSADDLREAQRAEAAFMPWSLDAPVDGRPDAATLADWLGAEDPAVERMLGMQAVAVHWGELPAREQKVLLMRFYGDMTQTQIGRQLGVSQMQVSRLLARALSYLRPRVLGLDDHPSGASPAVR